MSNKRLTAVWEHSIQKGTKLLALLSLADRADDDGHCWPSHEDTAERTRSKRTYVIGLISEIEADGEIYIYPRPGKTSKYLVVVGMTPNEIQSAMMKRFGYSREDAAFRVSEIFRCQRNRHVSSTEQVDEEVSVKQTPPVSSTEPEPSTTQNKPKPSKTAAPAATPPEPTTKITNEIRKHAETVFRELTGLEPLPKSPKAKKDPNGPRWWAPLKTICEMGEGNPEYIRALIEGAVKDLTPEFISAPQSILNTIPKIKARLNGSAPSAEPAYRQRNLTLERLAEENGHA